MQTLKKCRGIYLLVLLAMCGLSASAMGILTNTANVFFEPIEKSLGVETAPVKLTLTISNLVFAVAGILAARIITAKTFRPVVIACSLVYAGSTAALALCGDLVSLYAVNAVRGFAGGMVGNVVATTVIGYWFATDTGFISSIALGGSGLIGALFTIILGAIAGTGPDGWRLAYLVAGIAVLALNLPAMLLPITFRPHDAGMEALRVEAAAKGGKTAAPKTRTGNSRSLAVLIIAIALVSVASFCCALPQLLTGIAGSYDLAVAGTVFTAVTLVMNTVGKFLFGAMTDRLGVKWSVVIYGGVIALGYVILFTLRSTVPVLISSAFIGLCFSIPTVGAVMICRELFSFERYSQVFPKINLGATAANAIGYPVLAAIYDGSASADGVRSYNGSIILVFACMLLAVAGVIVAYRLADKEAAAK